MSYYAKGHHPGDKVDDFDDHDPTPYGGGYDISVTYGHSLPPSSTTCYPSTSASDSLDYSRPQFSSSAHSSSAYGNADALKNEYMSYTRPKSRPGGSGVGSGRGDHGFGQSVHGGLGQQRRPGGEYGSGQESRLEFGGGGHGRRNEYGDGGKKKSGYGDESEGGRGAHYEGEVHDRPKYGRSEDDDYKKPSYERRRHDDDNDDDDDKKKKNSYERRRHDDDDDDDKKKKNSYERRHHDDDDKGRHGHKKYGKNDSDDDDDEKKKKKQHNKHHERKHYDD